MNWYLGDGVTAEDHGGSIRISTPRMDGLHFIHIDHEMLETLNRFAALCWRDTSEDKEVEADRRLDEQKEEI